MKTLGSKLVFSTAANSNQGLNVTLGNSVHVEKGSAHHVVSTKVGVRALPDDIVGTRYVNRVVWCPDPGGFSGNCGNNQGQCTNCSCPDLQCDIVEEGFGRLAVIRLTPMAQLDCTADVEPWPNGNSVVNVDDLLTVINKWGTCASQEIPCEGDAFQDFVVDVNDLLAVINQWGDCISGLGGKFPDDIADCWNVYCDHLTGETWQTCVDRCVQAYCSQNPCE